MANPKRASGLLLLCFETVCVIIMISFFFLSLSFDAEAPSWQFVVVVVSFFSFAFSSASLYPFNIYLLTIKVLYNIEKGMERVTVDGPAAPRGKPVVDLCHHFRNFMIEKVKKKKMFTFIYFILFFPFASIRLLLMYRSDKRETKFHYCFRRQRKVLLLDEI